MASSSSPSSSSSAATRLGGAGYGGQGSPVPYRVAPLGYEPPVKCGCDLKSCRWISWSNGQPGRRYYRCRHAKTPRDCGFFEWIDEESSKWYKELLRDLRDTVWRLKKELKHDVVVEEPAVVDEVAQMNQVLQEELLKKDAALEAKDKELEALKAMLKKQHGWPRFLCCFGFHDEDGMMLS